MSWKNFFSSESSGQIDWSTLSTEAQLNEIVAASSAKPQLIFKHSTRCSISSMAKTRLEREWNLENVQPWYLDLIAHRNVSNAIADKLDIFHQSPQAILMVDGKVVYHASHSAIAVADMAKQLP